MSVISKIVLSKSCITIKEPDDAALKSLYDFYPAHSNRKQTEFKLSLRYVPEVFKALRGVDDTNVAALPSTVQSYYWQEINARRCVADLLQNGPTGNPTVTEHLTLMRHQQLGREIAAVRDRFGFFLDTRTGKTPLSLAIIYDDIQRHPDHKWLVVAPLILLDNAWLEDANKFVPCLKTVNLHASTKPERLKKMQVSANIYLTNIESFANYLEYYAKMGFHGCIVDESSCMKSYKSKQSKALVDFAQLMKRFYLLSARPAPNGYYEYYMQLKAIDYYSVAAFWTHFKNHYFVDISFSQYEQLELRGDKKDEFMALLGKYAWYVDQADVLTMAGRTFHTIELDMPDDLRKAYNKLRRELCIETEGKHLTTTGAGALYNKLRQVSSGFVIDSQAVKENKFYDEDNKEVYLLNEYRFEALKDLLDSIGDTQVIIWCSYRFEFEKIKQMLGNNCSMIYGAVSAEDKSKAISDFKAGKVQYLIAHPASAKFGLTLTNAHTAVYFSLTFSYEDWKQSSERIYGRIESQPEHCHYYVLLTKGAIDYKIYNEVLTGKHNGNLALLDHLKSVE